MFKILAVFLLTAFLATAHAQVTLELTSGGAQRVCTSVGNLQVTPTGIRGAVEPGCFDSGSTPGQPTDPGQPTEPDEPTGGDPGGNMLWNPTPINFVHGRGNLGELFVPRCVPTEFDNCRLNRRTNPRDTLNAGEVWSLRIPHASGPLRAYQFKVTRAETGESLNTYDLSVSEVIGDFNPGMPTGCLTLSGTAITVFDGTLTSSRPSYVCPIKPNTTYYLNVRPAQGTAGASDCGTSSANACRYRIVLPTGFPYND